MASQQQPTTATTLTYDALVDTLNNLAETAQPRTLVALVGPPGAGKSTLTAALAACPRVSESVQFLAMDGWHLDNAVLDEAGTRDRKGAPATFDARGLAAALRRIKSASPADDPVAMPVFDRSLDKSIAGAVLVPPPPAPSVIVMEGNYLASPYIDDAWADVAALFDVSVYVDAELDTLSATLIDRWLAHGLDLPAATLRTSSNDIPNARTVLPAKDLATYVIPRSAIPI